jgi:hypothetical protein
MPMPKIFVLGQSVVSHLHQGSQGRDERAARFGNAT